MTNLKQAWSGELTGSQNYLPGSAFELIVSNAGGGQTAQKLAQAADISIDLFTSPALSGVKMTTNSTGVLLNTSTAALFQAPRITRLETQALYRMPTFYKSADYIGQRSGVVGAVFVDINSYNSIKEDIGK